MTFTQKIATVLILSVSAVSRRLVAVLVCSGLLAAPTAVFAEASWYGSLRGGVMLDKGQDAKFYDGASRWGIKGSNEISEGLSAVYRFEHKFSTEDAGQPGGRLAYVGLSGGFGSLTLGQIWSASYNHAGVIRDIGNWYSSGDTSGRIGNTLSYAYSNDAFSVQFDAIMDGKKDSGKAIDHWELGATVNIGDVGKVAFAHVKKEDVKTGNKIVRVTRWTHTTTGTAANQWLYSPKLWSDGAKSTWAIRTAGTGANQYKEEFEAGTEMRIVVQPITVYVKKANANYDADNNQLKDAAAGELHGHPRFFTYYTTTGLDDPKNLTAVYPFSPSSDRCTTTPIPRDDSVCAKTIAYQADLKKTAVSIAPYWFAPGHVEDEMDYGEKSSHVSASFDVGAVTLGLGHSTTKSMDPMKTKKSKTNYIGASGGIGDTGLDWRAWYRTKEHADGMKTKPWGIGLGKTLGGGASAYVEHWNDGVKGAKKSSGTVVGLRVDF